MSLKENTIFGINDKVKNAINLLKEKQPIDKPYHLSFSGGKDSVVIHKLAQLAGISFKTQYNDTSVDPVELKKFIKKEYPEIFIKRPKESMFKLVIKKGPPMRNRRWCCDVLKEQNPKNSVIITGIRAEESARRAKRKVWEQSTKRKSVWFVHPIIDWNELDVWDFIEKYKLPYCSLYDEGFDRIGCVLCPMTRSYKQDLIRWPKMVNAWKISLRKFWERKEKENSGAITGWRNFEHFWHWWVDRDAKKIDLNQEDLFNVKSRK